MLFLQGTARQRNQRISRPGQTNALRHENLQTAAQKISQPHPRDGDDESGNLSSIFTILELYPLFIIQGYMQAVGGVGRGGGHGELDHYLSIHCWTFSTSCLQQDLTTARKVLQKHPLSPQLFVNGLPSSHCGELSILQQSR